MHSIAQKFWPWKQIFVMGPLCSSSTIQTNENASDSRPIKHLQHWLRLISPVPSANSMTGKAAHGVKTTTKLGDLIGSLRCSIDRRTPEHGAIGITATLLLFGIYVSFDLFAGHVSLRLISMSNRLQTRTSLRCQVSLAEYLHQPRLSEALTPKNRWCLPPRSDGGFDAGHRGPKLRCAPVMAWLRSHTDLNDSMLCD